MEARTKYYIESVEKRAKEIPSLNKSASLAFYNMLATADLLHAHWAPFAANIGISLAGWGVLNLLHYAEAGERPMGELGELMLVTPQNVTQLVNGLEKKRLVERCPCPHDGRVKLIKITKKGRDLVLGARLAHFETIREVFETLRDPELELLSDYLLRLQSRVEELAASKSRSVPPAKPKKKRAKI